jgi:hypothetical protein
VPVQLHEIALEAGRGGCRGVGPVVDPVTHDCVGGEMGRMVDDGLVRGMEGREKERPGNGWIRSRGGETAEEHSSVELSKGRSSEA